MKQLSKWLERTVSLTLAAGMMLSAAAPTALAAELSDVMEPDARQEVEVEMPEEPAQPDETEEEAPAEKKDDSEEPSDKEEETEEKDASDGEEPADKKDAKDEDPSDKKEDTPKADAPVAVKPAEESDIETLEAKKIDLAESARSAVQAVLDAIDKAEADPTTANIEAARAAYSTARGAVKLISRLNPSLASELNAQLDEYAGKIEHLEELRQQKLVQDANDALDKLEEELEGDDVSQTKLNAVNLALQAAKVAIGLVKDGPDKTALNNRLDELSARVEALKKALDNAAEAENLAKNAVAALEADCDAAEKDEGLTSEDIEALKNQSAKAKGYVDAVKDAELKADLLARLAAVNERIAKLNTKKNDAEKAVKTAEEVYAAAAAKDKTQLTEADVDKVQSAYDDAAQKVAALDDSVAEKAGMETRLAAVSAGIPALRKQVAFNQARSAVEKAQEAVEKAQPNPITIQQAENAYKTAKAAVDALEDSADKTELQNELNEVNKQLNQMKLDYAKELADEIWAAIKAGNSADSLKNLKTTLDIAHGLNLIPEATYQQLTVALDAAIQVAEWTDKASLLVQKMAQEIQNGGITNGTVAEAKQLIAEGKDLLNSLAGNDGLRTLVSNLLEQLEQKLEAAAKEAAARAAIDALQYAIDHKGDVETAYAAAQNAVDALEAYMPNVAQALREQLEGLKQAIYDAAMKEIEAIVSGSGSLDEKTAALKELAGRYGSLLGDQIDVDALLGALKQDVMDKINDIIGQGEAEVESIKNDDKMTPQEKLAALDAVKARVHAEVEELVGKKVADILLKGFDALVESVKRYIQWQIDEHVMEYVKQAWEGVTEANKSTSTCVEARETMQNIYNSVHEDLVKYGLTEEDATWQLEKVQERIDAFVAAKHHFAWVVTKEASYTEAGEQAYKCADCGTVQATEVIPMLVKDSSDSDADSVCRLVRKDITDKTVAAAGFAARSTLDAAIDAALNAAGFAPANSERFVVRTSDGSVLAKNVTGLLDKPAAVGETAVTYYALQVYTRDANGHKAGDVVVTPVGQKGDALELSVYTGSVLVIAWKAQ